MKEIVKIRYQIYILMKKVIILRKIQVPMKIFALPILNHFSLGLSRKKHVVMRAMRKKTKHIHTSAADLLHFRIRNFDMTLSKRSKRIYCLSCREVEVMLIASLRSWSAREASRHSAFMGNCPTISHTC